VATTDPGPLRFAGKAFKLDEAEEAQSAEANGFPAAEAELIDNTSGF
jgi:hypothetical protein